MRINSITVRTIWDVDFFEFLFTDTERKEELAYEQHRYFDIRRWMIAPEVINNAQGVEIIHKLDGTTNYSNLEVQDRGWNDNKSYFLPILLDELNRNENLIQNPGY